MIVTAPFSGPAQDVLDTLRVLTAAVGVMFVSYLGYLLLYRRRNVARFADRATRRLLAILVGAIIVTISCFARLGLGLSYILPLGMLFMALATSGLHVTAPPEHAKHEDDVARAKWESFDD